MTIYDSRILHGKGTPRLCGRRSAACAAADEAGGASVESTALFDLGCAADLSNDVICLEQGPTLRPGQPCLQGGGRRPAAGLCLWHKGWGRGEACPYDRKKLENAPCRPYGECGPYLFCAKVAPKSARGKVREFLAFFTKVTRTTFYFVSALVAKMTW